MIDTRGLAFFAFAGMGAVVGFVVAVPLALIGVVFPVVWGWLWVPILSGTVIGAVFGALAE